MAWFGEFSVGLAQRWDCSNRKCKTMQSKSRSEDVAAIFVELLKRQQDAVDLGALVGRIWRTKDWFLGSGVERLQVVIQPNLAQRGKGGGGIWMSAM